MASPQEGAQASWGTDIPKQEKATLFSRFRDILHKFREALFSTDPPKDKKEEESVRAQAFENIAKQTDL